MDMTLDMTRADLKEAEASETTMQLKLDHNGLPLIPQPSEDPLDPLNFPKWLKLTILIEVSALSLLSLLGASVITPTFGVLSKEFHKSLTETAYITSVFVLTIGLSSAFWNPLANVYGRRPVYLVCIVGSVATAAGSAASTAYGELLALRALNGVFAGIPLGLGSVTVRDLFFVHERGRYMGIWTLSFILGGHAAPTIGGYIEKDLSWRWCFWVATILTSAMLPLFIFTVPETLYIRHALVKEHSPARSFKDLYMFHSVLHPVRKLRSLDFFRPVQMIRFPSVLLPTIYYSVSFVYGSIIFVVTSAAIFGKAYRFKPYQTGLLLGVPLTVDSLLGELLAGALSDWTSEKRALKRPNRSRKQEDRLLALFPALILLPLGVIIEGVCIQRKTHWSAVGLGIGIASFGLQIQTTVVYTYTAECYGRQTIEIGLLLNFCRELFGFFVGFYALPLSEKIGFQNAWIILAFLIVATSLPVLILFFRGEQWRQWLGEPEFDKEL